MATKSQTQEIFYPYPSYPSNGPRVAINSFRYEGSNSTRDAKGDLILRSNPLVWNHSSRVLNRAEIENYRHSERRLYSLYSNAGKNHVGFRTIGSMLKREVGSTLYNKAYSSFRGRLYSGSAALGVTLGTYKESRQMMVDRFNSLNQRADEAAARIATARNKPKVVASLHLEIVFGWVPLLSDIHAVTTTVIGKDPLLDIQTVKGTARATLADLKGKSATTQISYSGMYEVEVGSRVRVSNMNLWLAERAGLLNPASVVWDLVPWSFVVNMFMNTGQLVNSLTDFVGLSFENQYVQHKYAGVAKFTEPSYGGTTIIKAEKGKERSTGSIPRPTFMFKIPNANMGLAAIAGSLFTQKAAALGRLIKPVVKNW